MSGQQVTIAGVLVKDADGNPTTGSISVETASGEPAVLMVVGGLEVQLAGEDIVNDVIQVEQGNGFVGKNFTASATTVFSPTGKAGDKIHKLIIRVTGTGSLVTLVDGANSYQLLSTGMVVTTDTGGANVYLQTIELELNITSENDGWSITTGTNALGVAIGRFS